MDKKYDKKKPYMVLLQEELDLYKEALFAIERYHAAEARTRNTAYKNDAERTANIVKAEMDEAIAKAKEYGENND